MKEGHDASISKTAGLAGTSKWDVIVSGYVTAYPSETLSAPQGDIAQQMLTTS